MGNFSAFTDKVLYFFKGDGEKVIAKHEIHLFGDMIKKQLIDNLCSKGGIQSTFSNW